MAIVGRTKCTRACEISRRRDAKGASRRVSSNFRARVCISPAPQSPSPKLETTRSLMLFPLNRTFGTLKYQHRILLTRDNLRKSMCILYTYIFLIPGALSYTHEAPVRGRYSQILTPRYSHPDTHTQILTPRYSHPDTPVVAPAASTRVWTVE